MCAPGPAEANAALARAGRCREVAGNPRVKEVGIGEGERLIVCHSPQAAVRDAAVRRPACSPHGEDRGPGHALERQAAEFRGVVCTKPGRWLMGQVLDLRPVHRRRGGRIGALVVLCRPALLLARLIETSCEGSWLPCSGRVFRGPSG
jgi:hypothetical protein